LAVIAESSSIPTLLLPPRRSSLRTRAPQDTLARAQAWMPPLGISRVTDITRMDRLGLPVCASVRPRGRTLRVHAGKGVHPIDARVGALMEAVEYAVAEPQRTPWIRERLPLRDLLAACPGMPRAFDLAPRLDAMHDLRGAILTLPPGGPEVIAAHLDRAIDLDRLVDAVRCESVADGRAVLLPAELVFVPFDPDDGPSLFGWSTNGLASGNSVAEATLHGLLEVLERDAVAMNVPHDASRWVDPATLPPPFDALASQWASLGVALSVRAVPNAFGLPCFDARLHEPASTTVDLARGFGLHLDRGIAVSRAICEAAQARLSHIHGGRDDITQFFDSVERVDSAERAADRAQKIAAAFDTGNRIAFDAIPQWTVAGATLEALLDRLLSQLRAAGFAQVLRHRFDFPMDDLHVVKVVVPRCEDHDTPPQRMGARLIARVIGRD
jgi:ribosomal protein S12 methylthiotransferase accessory factor